MTLALVLLLAAANLAALYRLAHVTDQRDNALIDAHRAETAWLEAEREAELLRQLLHRRDRA